MKIADFAIRHPAIIIILLIAVLVFGLIALSSLKQDMFPEIGLPTVAILTAYPGVGAEDIEREITDVIEDEIGTLSGIENLSSNSRDSNSVIQVEFEWGTDVDQRISDIREKINNVMSELPDGISGPPTILKVSVDLLPVYSVQVEGDMSPQQLSNFVDERLLPCLSQVDEVSTVKLQGKKEMIVDIEVQLDRLESVNLSILEVLQALEVYNITFPSGSVVYRNQELKMRSIGEYENLKEIEETVVGMVDGSRLRLSDIAELSKREKDPDMHALSEGKDVLVVDVMKQQGSDTNSIVAEVKNILDDVEGEYNRQIRFRTVADQSVDIKRAINSVRSAAVLGGILAVVILFLFLHNIRSTLIISFSIPVSVLIAFIALKLGGQSLNLMTLGGLTVGIGMIVDSSIVVLENIYKHFSSGLPRAEAASKGTSEVGGAIVASTSTTLSVFIPLLFVQGFAGTVLRDVAFTIVYSLTAALFVAIIVVPFLASSLLKTDHKRKNHPLLKRLSGSIEGVISGLTRFYRRLLKAAIRSRGFILIFSAAVLGLSVYTYSILGFEFVPQTDMNEIQMDIETPSGFTLERTREKVAEIDAVVRELVPELEVSLYYVGQGDSFGFSKALNVSFTRLRLISSKERERSVFDIIEMLRKKIPSRVPDIDINIVNGGLGALAAMATGGQGFMIELYGSTMDDLITTAKRVETIMGEDPNIAKTEINISFNRQEIASELNLDYLGQLGISPYEAGLASRIIFNGMEIGTYREEGESYELFLNSEISGEKISSDVLNRISLRSPSGKLISYANIADFEIRPTISNINHEDQMRSIIVTGYLRNPDVRATMERTTEQLDAMSLPIGLSWDVGGSTAEMAESFQTLLYSMLVAVFLVYAVMVIQFERFAQPLIVMAAVPFTFIGVVAALSISGSTLSIVSFLGIIALAGIVVNNAIVMIDYINLLRDRDGMMLFEAVLEGAGSRLKPILMTTLTTILGLLPMALGMGEGAGVYSPLGQAIAGGLITSTFITLFLVPVLYYILEHRKENLRQKSDFS